MYKIERKSRLVGHILKTHVPIDKSTVLLHPLQYSLWRPGSHIKKYQRHWIEQAKSGMPDYSQVLKRASHPICVGDKVMVVKEESLKWYAHQSEDPFLDQDSLYTEEEGTTMFGVVW